MSSSTMNNNNNNIDEQFEQQVERTITQYEKDFNNDVDFEAGKLTKEMEKAKLTVVLIFFLAKYRIRTCADEAHIQETWMAKLVSAFVTLSVTVSFVTTSSGLRAHVGRLRQVSAAAALRSLVWFKKPLEVEESMIGGAECDGGEYSDNGNMCAQPALSSDGHLSDFCTKNNKVGQFRIELWSEGARKKIIFLL